MKQAVILAGGKGTRLSNVISDVPKPMAPIKNKPFLNYLLEMLKKAGFNKFLLLTSYKSETIEDYYKDIDNITFIKEDIQLGTGGALLNAYKHLEEDFFVLNADTFFDIDFSLMENFSIDKPCSIALRYSSDIERYGYVEIDNDFKISSFIEKTKKTLDKVDGYINAGIYYFKKSSLNFFIENYNRQNLSLEKDIFPKLVKQKILYALPLGGFFIDIGIPEDYYKAQMLLPERITMKKMPALFIDKDGTIIEDTGYPSGKNINIIDSTIDIIKEYNKKDYYIVMVTNQAGIAKGKYSIEQMQEGFNSIKDYYKEYNIVFDDIEYCPYHISGTINKYKFDSLLRKPNPGMILKACEKLKIDLKNSIMIGDSKISDIIKLPYLKCEIIKG